MSPSPSGGSDDAGGAGHRLGHPGPAGGVLSIGSTLGDRRAALRGAVDAFRSELVAVSPVYETPPWGPVPQGDYYNAVLIADDPAAAAGDWLRRAHVAEQAAGRTRDVRWGARTLDVD